MDGLNRLRWRPITILLLFPVCAIAIWLAGNLSIVFERPVRPDLQLSAYDELPIGEMNDSSLRCSLDTTQGSWGAELPQAWTYRCATPPGALNWISLNETKAPRISSNIALPAGRSKIRLENGAMLTTGVFVTLLMEAALALILWRIRPAAVRRIALPPVALGACLVAPVAAVCMLLAGDLLHLVPQGYSNIWAFESSGLMIFAAIALAPFVEELIFRALLIPLFAEYIGNLAALCASTGLFVAGHLFLTSGVFFLTYYVTLGLYLGWVWLRFGSLVLCVAAHALINMAVLVYSDRI